jgi:importin subunit alpha-6/7
LACTQFEAAWIVALIANKSKAMATCLSEADAIPSLLDCIANTASESLKGHAFWAIGSMAESLFYDIVKYNAIDAIVQELQKQREIDTLGNIGKGISALAKIVHMKKVKPLEVLQPLIDLLAHFIMSTDKQIVSDVCWALSSISEMNECNVQAVLDAGVAHRLVELLMDESLMVHKHALRTIGNICTGSESQLQVSESHGHSSFIFHFFQNTITHLMEHVYVCMHVCLKVLLDLGLVPCLVRLIESPLIKIRREVYWTISNITAGTDRQIQTIIDAGLIPILMKAAESEADKLSRETILAVSNVCYGTPEQIHYFVRNGCLRTMCLGLKGTDRHVVDAMLESLKTVFHAGLMKLGGDSAVNPYCVAFGKIGGTDILKELQCRSSRAILEDFFRD